MVRNKFSTTEEILETAKTRSMISHQQNETKYQALDKNDNAILIYKEKAFAILLPSELIL